MKASKITTAAYLAGATTLAVTLPAFAAAPTYEPQTFEPAAQSQGLFADLLMEEEISILDQPFNDEQS